MGIKNIIRIEEVGRNNLRFVKLRKLDTNNDQEKRFFDEIFTDREIITTVQLKNNFAFAINYTKKYFKERFILDKSIYDSVSTHIQQVLTIILAIFLVCLYRVLKYLAFKDLFENFEMLFLEFLFIYLIIASAIKMIETLRQKTFFYMGLLIFYGLSLTLFVLGFGFRYNLEVMILAFTLICFILSLLFVSRMKRLSRKGAYLYGQVLGLRRYLEYVEVSQIEMFAQGTPERFYQSLSFAYALGLSEVWYHKLERISTISNHKIDISYIGLINKELDDVSYILNQE